jgi:phage-related protein
MAAFPTTVTPVKSSGKKTSSRIIEAQFGDGYTQRAGDGINTVVDTWNLEWNCLDSTSYLEMVNFLKARGGYESFTFIPPGESSSKKFTCKEWSTSHPGNSKYILTADFLEVFDL